MIDGGNKVERLIYIFSNETEELLEELDMSSFDLIAFQKAFNVSEKNDPMIYSYQIEPRHVDFISKYLAKEHSWDFNKYSYFLEASAIE